MASGSAIDPAEVGCHVWSDSNRRYTTWSRKDVNQGTQVVTKRPRSGLVFRSSGPPVLAGGQGPPDDLRMGGDLQRSDRITVRVLMDETANGRALHAAASEGRDGVVQYFRRTLSRRILRSIAGPGRLGADARITTEPGGRAVKHSRRKREASARERRARPSGSDRERPARSGGQSGDSPSGRQTITNER
jgi:hypothetical protein